jgi:phosphoglucosamine mutase
MGKLFGTDGVRGMANAYPMTPEIVLRLGKAVAHIFSNHERQHTILIGKDTRISGYMFENALTAGITSMGANVLLVGPMPTPAIAHLTKSFAADAGIMISASHNPAEDNGIKFFAPDGYKLSDEMEAKIEELVLSKEISSEHARGTKVGKAFRIDDARGRYIEFIKSVTENRSLKGLSIVLDCANGASYSVSPLIFRELGANVTVINAQPDGLNINLNCGALYPGLTKQAVLDSKADVGIALDGDADRVILIDEKGNVVDGDQILAMLALDWSERKLLKKNTIVITEYTNLGLDTALKKKGIKTIRVENGDRHVQEALKKSNMNLGGEQTGHIILPDYSTTADGTLAALLVMDLMKRKNKKLSGLADCFEKLPQILINIPVKHKRPIEDMPNLVKKINQLKRALGKSGRIFIRYSGTQQMLRILLEGKKKSKLSKAGNQLAREFIKELEK